MGYETKLIIGVSYNHLEKDRYLSVVATIDLCKSDFKDTFMDKETDTKTIFFYGTDGNTQIREDMYGSKLFEISPEKVLKFMKDHNKIHTYRRYNAAIPLLSNLIKGFKGENLKCILFGH